MSHAWCFPKSIVRLVAETAGTKLRADMVELLKIAPLHLLGSGRLAFLAINLFAGCLYCTMVEHSTTTVEVFADPTILRNSR